MSTPAALQTLLSRYSLGVKHLIDPAPDAADLQQMLAAALRAPDHGDLVPFRLAVVQGDARARLADLFADHARARGKDAEGIAMERERALCAPMTVAVIARIDLGHTVVPAHEQWMAVGGAVANFLNAAHALGFAGKMLSGDKARSPQVIAAFCAPGETLVGWVVLGTPVRTPRGDARKDGNNALSYW
jgi:nitroreductase